MSKELKELEIKRLFKEYDYLLIEDEYKKVFIEEHKPTFLKEINELREKLNKPPKENPQLSEENKNIKKDVIEVNRETRRKIKKIYHKIAKITHPDKTSVKKLIETHAKAKRLYEQNNLMGLYLVCVDLNIDVDLGDLKIEELKQSIEKKRNQLGELKNSYLWLWVNANSDLEREKIINLFIEQNS